MQGLKLSPGTVGEGGGGGGSFGSSTVATVCKYKRCDNKTWRIDTTSNDVYLEVYNGSDDLI